MTAQQSTSLPGPKGLANLRWSIRLARDIFGTLPSIEQTFGDVVELGFGPYRAVYVFGAPATNELFAQGPPHVSWHDAMAPLIPVDGDTAIVVSDGDDHERRRRVVQPAFGRRRLDDTVALMQSEARRTFAAWQPGTEQEVYRSLRACIRRIVVRALFGDDLGERADEFGDQLEEALTYINRPPWTRFDHDWPGTPYRRAMRSRAAVDRIVYEEIARRRQLDDVGERVDLLSVLIAAQDSADGLSDTELRDQVISLIAAGYDTTSAAAAWLVQFLAEHNEARADLVAEVDSVVGAHELAAEHLQRMPWLGGVVSEALRLGPPGYVAGRRIEQAFEIRGHTLRPGPFVFYCPLVTHRLAELWPEPDEFRPGRWVEGHQHFHEIPSGAWIPFGGGARRCLGFAFAITELKVLAVEMIRATGGSFTPRRTAISPTGLASMRPSGDVIVSIGRAVG